MIRPNIPWFPEKQRFSPPLQPEVGENNWLFLILRDLRAEPFAPSDKRPHIKSWNLEGA
jgi:hypothetical protein